VTKLCSKKSTWPRGGPIQRGMLKKHHGFRVGYYGQPNTIIGRRMTKEDKCKNKKKRIIFFQK